MGVEGVIIVQEVLLALFVDTLLRHYYLNLVIGRTEDALQTHHPLIVEAVQFVAI